MISASRYVAESRNAFPEASNLLAAANYIEEKLSITIAEGAEIKEVDTVVIFCDEISAIVGNIIDHRKTPSAQIFGKHIYSNLYYENEGTLTIEVIRDIPENLLSQWMRIIQEYSPTFIVAMSSSSQILSSATEGSVRTLLTSNISSELLSRKVNSEKDSLCTFKYSSSVLTELVQLEQLSPGNIITGHYCDIIL